MLQNARKYFLKHDVNADTRRSLVDGTLHHRDKQLSSPSAIMPAFISGASFGGLCDSSAVQSLSSSTSASSSSLPSSLPAPPDYQPDFIRKYDSSSSGNSIAKDEHMSEKKQQERWEMFFKLLTLLGDFITVPQFRSETQNSECFAYTPPFRKVALASFLSVFVPQVGGSGSGLFLRVFFACGLGSSLLMQSRFRIAAKAFLARLCRWPFDLDVSFLLYIHAYVLRFITSTAVAVLCLVVCLRRNAILKKVKCDAEH